MPMLPRPTQWRSLAGALATAAAATVAVALIEAPGRSTIPVPGGAAAATARVGDATLSRGASAVEARPNRGARPTANDRASGHPGLALYMLIEAARPLPMFSR
jgi:hypothetical protein